MDRSVRFWNRFAERYAKQDVADAATYREKLKRTQKHLTPESKVLEFGCGTGSTALVHAPNVQSIVAIDSSEKMVEIANRKLSESSIRNIEFKCGTLFDLPFEDGEFDAVLGLNVLHLIENYELSIRKSYDLLRPNGVFVTSTACLSGTLNPLRFVLPAVAMLGLIPKVQFIAVDELERHITDCGFTLLEKLAPPRKMAPMFLIAEK